MSKTFAGLDADQVVRETSSAADSVFPTTTEACWRIRNSIAQLVSCGSRFPRGLLLLDASYRLLLFYVCFVIHAYTLTKLSRPFLIGGRHSSQYGPSSVRYRLEFVHNKPLSWEIAADWRRHHRRNATAFSSARISSHQRRVLLFCSVLVLHPHTSNSSSSRHSLRSFPPQLHDCAPRRCTRLPPDSAPGSCIAHLSSSFDVLLLPTTSAT